MTKGPDLEILDEGELLPKAEEIRTLPPERRKDYARSVIEEFVHRHPNGATAYQIARATGLSKKTVYNHLEVLTAMRRAVKKEYGRRQRVYFPVTDETASLQDYTLKLASRRYAFRRADQDGEACIQIQEREIGTDGIVRTRGGILVSMADMAAFVKHLVRFAEEAER